MVTIDHPEVIEVSHRLITKDIIDHDEAAEDSVFDYCGFP